MIFSRRVLVALVAAITVGLSSTEVWAAPKFESGDYVMHSKTERNGAETVRDQPVKIEVAADGSVKITSTESERPPLVGKITDGKLLVKVMDGPANVTLTGTVTADNAISGEMTAEVSGMTLKGTFTLQKAGK